VNPQPPTPVRQPGARLRGALGLALVLLVGTGVRLVPWDEVFTPDGVRFVVDTDPHYHVLRVHRAIAEWPRVAPRDPWLDYPNGVDIVWPPLFDEAMAAAAEVAGAGHPTAVLVERVAAIFPVVLGVATVATVAWLGSAFFGGGLWIAAALLLALLPVHARFSMVGRPDQHVAEVLLFCCVLLAFVRGFKAGRRWMPAALLGFSLCVAFRTWQGSALNLAVLCWVLAVWHILAPRGERTAEDMAFCVGVGAAAASLLLALSLASFGPSGALVRMSLSGLTGFSAVLCAVAAAFSGLVLLLRRKWPANSAMVRVLQVVVAGAVAALPLLLPAMWPPLRQGAMAFARSGKWYSTISEFSPMFGQYRLADELPYRFAQLGLTLLVAPFAVVPLARAWRERPQERAVLCAFAMTFGLFFALALLRVRFGAYLAPLLALAVALVLRSLSERLAKRLGIESKLAAGAFTLLGVALVAVPTPGHIREGLAPDGLGTDETLVHTLERLRALAPAVAERPAVLSRWPIGHLVRYYAEKPVVTNGFGIEGGERSLDDWAAFAFASDDQTAERILERRKIGFLVLGDPGEVIEHDRPFAPDGTPPVVSRTASGELRPLPAFYDLELTRIGVFNGSERPGHSEAGLGHFRLTLESLPGSMTSALKVFGWVPGCSASFRVGRANEWVHVAVRTTSNLGRSFEWRSSAVTDSTGRAVLLLPYATGANGYLSAAPYEVAAGPERAAFLVPESCVTSGGVLEFDFGRTSSR